MTTTDVGGRAAPPAAGPGAGVGPQGLATTGRGVKGGSGLTPYLFLAPYMILFTVFVLAPSIFVIWISLHDWDFLLPGKPFVGLENYLNLFKAGTVTSGPFWSSMLATDKIGIHSNIAWVNETPWVWAALVGPTVWWTLGFNTVIYLAGLQDIPRELYEAAKVDGAGRWAQFRNVTLPGLRPVLIFVVTTTILASANVFGQPYLITNGRPGIETRSAIMHIGQVGLREFRMGNAASASFILTLALILVSLVTFVAFRERKER